MSDLKGDNYSLLVQQVMVLLLDHKALIKLVTNLKGIQYNIGKINIDFFHFIESKILSLTKNLHNIIFENKY